MKRLGLGRKVWLILIATGAAVLVASCAGRGGGTIQPGVAKTSEEEVRAVVAEFERANRAGDFLAMRGILAGKMADWAEKTGQERWKKDLAGKDNEFVVQSVTVVSSTEAKASVLFRDRAENKEELLVFTLLHDDTGWRIADSTKSQLH